MKTNLLQKNIPKGWEIKKIKDLLDFEQPTKYIVESSSYTPDGKTPVLTANKSFVLGYTNETDGIYTDTPAIIFDDFTTDSKYVDFPFKVKSSAIKILTNRDKNTDLKFVYEIMKSFNFPIANHKRHYISQYQELDIVIPLVDEQKKIAEILSSVDKEIEKTEDMIIATEKLKRGLLQELLIVKTGNKLIKLSEIATIVRGGSPRPIEKFITDESDGLNWLKIGDIESGAKYITHTGQKIKKSGLNRTTMVHPGDFILSNSMSFGRPYIMKIDACIHDGWLAFKEIKKDLVTIEFLYYLLSSELLQANFTSLATGSGVKNLKRESVANISVKLPSIKEQENIVSILSSVDSKILLNRNIKEKLTQLKKGLVSDLLSGKVRTINN